jgi:DNA-directed RNA polymerase specialized sigma24 family protein
MGQVDDDEEDSNESGDSPVDDTSDLEDDAEGSEDATDDPDDDTDDSLRITAEALHAFVALPATRRRAARIVGKRIPPQEVSSVVSEAISDALGASRRPAEDRVKAWFDVICRKAVARWHRKRAKQKLREGPMPVAAQPLDEAGLPLEDPGDAVVDIDPSFDPAADDFRAEGLLFTRWMRSAVADDPRDRETWAMMEEWARSQHEDEQEKTYEDIAREHAIGVSALKKRIERLKDKYEKRYRQWRKRFMVMLMLLGGALVIALAILVWWLLQPRAPTAIPIAPEPTPSTSATPVVLPPLEDNKNIAEPPGPPAPLK